MLTNHQFNTLGYPLTNGPGDLSMINFCRSPKSASLTEYGWTDFQTTRRMSDIMLFNHIKKKKRLELP